MGRLLSDTGEGRDDQGKIPQKLIEARRSMVEGSCAAPKQTVG